MSFHPNDVALARAIGNINLTPPDYSTNRGACYIAELSIERMGLKDRYATMLLAEVSEGAQIYGSEIIVDEYEGEHRDGWALVFALVTASPEVRVRAMLRAFGQEVPHA